MLEGFFGRREKGEREPMATLAVDMARHGKKGAKPREALTPEGMTGTVKAGLEAGRELPFGDIYGSPRERTGQSSALRGLAEEFKEVDFSAVDPEDIVRWLQEGGMQKTETPFLNFQAGEGDYNTHLMDEFKAGRYLTWLAEKSDTEALETKQAPDKATPLSVQAGNVAAFVFGRVWEGYDKLNNGEKVASKLDFATSHQGVIESFLYKVIKKQEGEEAAAKLVEELKGTGGFAENQGIKAEVMIYDKDNPEDWAVRIKYKNKEYLVKSHELVGIIQEGEELKNKLAEAREE